MPLWLQGRCPGKEVKRLQQMKLPQHHCIKSLSKMLHHSSEDAKFWILKKTHPKVDNWGFFRELYTLHSVQQQPFWDVNWDRIAKYTVKVWGFCVEINNTVSIFEDIFQQQYRKHPNIHQNIRVWKSVVGKYLSPLLLPFPYPPYSICLPSDSK